MSAEQNKALIEQYIKRVWNEGDWSFAEEIVDPDVVFHDQIREGRFPPGRAGMRAAMEVVRTGMPDFTLDVHEMIAEGDLVVIRWSSTATHAGMFNGFPATGRVATLYAISMVRIADGRIVEGWQEADQLGMGRQMGMVPDAELPGPIASLLSFVIRVRDRRRVRRAA
ncbi:ester cyclase [Nocardia sp. NPDC059239]|uniref:ester cyclase n=1 Tax=unclassified Nocardia TaxID=2637762 RepID=UPI003683D00E